MQQSLLPSIPLNTSARRPPTAHQYFLRDQLAAAAQMPLKLVPIRLDLDFEGLKLKEQFAWNLSETLVTPEHFAQLLVADLDTPAAGAFVPLIAESIRQQCETYASVALEDEFEAQLEAVPPGEGYSTQFDDERIIVKLDIHVGILHLRDQFEWPLYRTNGVTPEHFAQQLAADLGVAGEFVPAIAHSIREQVAQARLSNADRRTPEWRMLARKPYRPENGDEDMWAPELRELDEDEIERIMREKERSARRLRRTTKQHARHRYTANAMHYGYGAQTASPTYPGSWGMPNASASSQMMMPALPTWASANPLYAQQHQQQQMRFMQQHQQSHSRKVPYQNYQPTPDEIATMARYGAVAGGEPASKGPSPSKRPRSTTPGPESAALLAKQLDALRDAESNATEAAAAAARAGNSPPKKHRGFGASARMFNEDGSIDVGEFRKNWKCSWCLMSGKFTPTLRKGPLGSKTLCNACGIWFSKHGSLPQERFREHAE